MNKYLLLLIFFTISFNLSNSQTKLEKKPKLIVGIVVDQMRFDQLYKYEKRYSNGGFKRLISEGFNYKNAHYNYIPTVTASGHASIYTGATPDVHGIIGNSWFDRYLDREVENIEDNNEQIVGSKEENNKGASPHYMLTTTISDQLRLATNFKSKVISASLKDRGAILPGGHTANAAYWYDWKTSPGYFVTSTYYMNQLPKWVTDFNTSKKADNHLDKTWNTLYPIETYISSDLDNNTHERVLRGKNSPTFPYNFKELRKVYKERDAEYQLLWVSPEGNTILTEFAIEAINKEELGSDDITDLLNIGYSVTDVAGHTFGPQSVELEDIYLRLDKNIEDLLNYLDKQIGKGEYMVFLTSDHAAIPVASYLEKHKLPTGVARIRKYQDTLTNYLNTKYNRQSWIQSFDGEQIYLNRNVIKAQGLSLLEIQQDVVDFLRDLEGIHSVLTAHHLQTVEYNSGGRKMLQNGYYGKRSGDISLIFDPGYIQSSNSEIKVKDVKGTTHGSGYAYDTHIPMLWFGSGVPSGESVRKVPITTIASSLAMFLNLQLPSGSSGNTLYELFEKK